MGFFGSIGHALSTVGGGAARTLHLPGAPSGDTQQASSTGLTAVPRDSGSWWDQNPYGGGGMTGSAPVAAPQAQMQTGGGQYPLASVSGEGFLAPWTTPFQAPSVDQMRQDPAYQFAFDEGRNQIERGAAAKGTLLTGGTLKDLTAWSQGLASQQFDKIYNRAHGEYQDAYNIFKQNQQDQWNKLSGLAQVGQGASQQLGGAAQNYGNQASANMQAGANAQAAATAGSGSVWGSTIGTLGNIGGSLAMRYPWGGTGGGGTSSYSIPGGNQGYGAGVPYSSNAGYQTDQVQMY
jgi:hypothetical protein